MRNSHIPLLFVGTICLSVYNVVWRLPLPTPQDHSAHFLLRQFREQGKRLDRLNDSVARLESKSLSASQDHTSTVDGTPQWSMPTTSLTNSNLMNRLKRFEEQLEVYAKEIETLKFKSGSKPKPNNVDSLVTNNGTVVGVHTKIGNHIRSNISTKRREVTAGMNGTVVTAYFEIPSKHPTTYYTQWMEHMLAIDDPLVVFTTSDWVGRIMSFRSHATSRTTIIEVRLDDVPIATKYNKSVWDQQFKLDPIGKYRKGYRLYWIWLSKTHFLNEAIRLNPYGSSHFMWMDIGCFRGGNIFANQTVMRHLEAIPNESVLFVAHREPSAQTDPWFTDMKGTSPLFFTSGSMFAGTKETIELFHKRFLETVQGYMVRGLFVGEDQTILQSTCVQNYGLCQYVKSKEVKGEVSYFALRSVLRFGGDQYHYWIPPKLP